MHNAAFLPVALVSVLLFSGGCTHYISQSSRAQADRSVDFSQLSASPDAYRGKLVMLGGTVAKLDYGPEGTRLEVTEHRLDRRELPDETIPSGGRFLATTTRPLDSCTYKPGALVVLVGNVVGQKSEQFPGTAAGAPVIAVREIRSIVIEKETHWGYYGGD